MPKKYVKTLTPEQEGLVNDLIIALAKAERNDPELYKKGILVSMYSETFGTVTAFGKWITDEKSFLNDILLIKFGGLTTDRLPEQKQEPETLNDRSTVLIGGKEPIRLT